MNKITELLIVLFMSIAIVGHAETPTAVTVIPHQRYIFNEDPFDCEIGYKLDTRIGKIWEIKNHWNYEKTQITEFTGIECPAETNSFDGRFSFKVQANNGDAWIYVFDSKTGNLWTCRIGRSNDYIFHLLTQ